MTRMAVEKARWFNDAKCAVVLTVDDLTNGYMDITGTGEKCFNDWGHRGRGENSMFRYFERFFLEKFPEVKYTAFVAFGRHSIGMVQAGHPCYAADAFEDREFGELLQYIVSSGNEVAYHGHSHGHTSPTVDPSTWVGEHRQYGAEQYLQIVTEDLERIRRELGIAILGGRSPGNVWDDKVKVTILSGLFKWWSSPFTPYNCDYAYDGNVFLFPNNVNGAIFRARINRRLLGTCLRPSGLLRTFKAKNSISLMAKKRHILSVVEHLMLTRPDGTHQGPSIFNDIHSLDRIFAMIRDADPWYGTCSEIAHYQDSYDHTELRTNPDGSFELSYSGAWDKPFQTLTANTSRLQDLRTGAMIQGARRPGRWVFNNIPVGSYRPV